MTREPDSRSAGAAVDSPPPWSRNRTLYQVNLRQYTPSGTLREFETHLPRLADLGVGILWFMPIHPIGRKGRKGTLGSYYAVRGYRRVNPEHGTLRDFDRVVRHANALGLEVILDWVPNHTAWDHPWVRTHPEWYRRDANGRILPPVPGWTDVAQLDYGPEAGVRETYPSGRNPSTGVRPRQLSPANRALWDEMQASMEFWVRDHGVAGFRCDVAAFLPLRFWQETRERLTRHREIFLLAEADGPRMHDRAFDATYGWTLQRGLEDVRRGHRKPHGLEAERAAEVTGATPAPTVTSASVRVSPTAPPFDARALEALLRRDLRDYPPNAFRMQMTSNHDANSWTGSVLHRLGADGAELGAVLSFVFPGIPLIYNGQEAGSRRRLAFFDKDEISWPRNEHRFTALYRPLTGLKRTCPLLSSGREGAPLRFLRHDDPNVLAFVREDDRGALLGVFRLGTKSEPGARRSGSRSRSVSLSPRCRFALSLRFSNRGATGLPREIPSGARRIELCFGQRSAPRWEFGVWISG